MSPKPAITTAATAARLRTMSPAIVTLAWSCLPPLTGTVGDGSTVAVGMTVGVGIGDWKAATLLVFEAKHRTSPMLARSIIVLILGPPRQALQDLFVGDVVGPAVGVEDGVVAFFVGQVAQLPAAAVAWVAQDLGTGFLGDVGQFFGVGLVEGDWFAH